MASAEAPAQASLLPCRVEARLLFTVIAGRLHPASSRAPLPTGTSASRPPLAPPPGSVEAPVETPPLP
eukprot:9906035-Alexandrium_andersonii.AAC.1